jgi:hypothetical protein
MEHDSDEIPATEDAVQSVCDDNSKLPSLNLIFDETKRVTANLERHFAVLDGKSNFQLGASSLLIAGVTLIAQAEGRPDRLANHINTWKSSPISGDRLITLASGIEVGLFVCFLVCSYLAYRLRPYTDAPLPSKVQFKYMCKPEIKTKQVILGRLAAHFDANLEQSTKKGEMGVMGT